MPATPLTYPSILLNFNMNKAIYVSLRNLPVDKTLSYQLIVTLLLFCFTGFIGSHVADILMARGDKVNKCTLLHISCCCIVIKWGINFLISDLASLQISFSIASHFLSFTSQTGCHRRRDERLLWRPFKAGLYTHTTLQRFYNNDFCSRNGFLTERNQIELNWKHNRRIWSICMRSMRTAAPYTEETYAMLTSSVSLSNLLVLYSVVHGSLSYSFGN